MDHHGHISGVSEETLEVLQELDPSPILSPEDENRKLSDSPSPPKRSSTLGLGGHNAAFYRKSNFHRASLNHQLILLL